MAVYAAYLQLNMLESIGTNAIFDVFYGVVDSTAQTAHFGEVRVEVPMATPGTWTDSFIDALVTDAATMGYTLTRADVRWLYYEPGDYRNSVQAVNWTKDATKTNLPSTYTNIYAGNAGEGQLVNFTPYKQYRFVVHVNKVGTGTQDAALVDVTNAANLVSVSDTGAAGEHTLDSGWVNLPAWATGEQIVKPMAKSSVTTDDPVYHQFALYLR